MSNLDRAVHAVEHSAPAGNDQHTHNFSDVYKELSSLQRQDGGAGSPQFKQDLAELNTKLHNDGVLPNLSITGIDNNDHIMTRNLTDHTDVTQNASSVNDFGNSNHNANDYANANGNMSERLMRDEMLANAFGAQMSQNPDGSFNLTSPLLDQSTNEATASILNTVMHGLLGGDSSSDPRNPDDAPAPTPFGMNPLEAQAWNGWGDQPSDDDS